EMQKNRINQAQDAGREARAVHADYRLDSGQILTARIAREAPGLPGFVDDTVPAVREGLVSFREKVGDLYQKLIDWNNEYPLAAYIFLTFIVLALIAFIVQQDKRKKRWSKAIVIPRAGADSSNSRREQVLAAEVD